MGNLSQYMRMLSFYNPPYNERAAKVFLNAEAEATRFCVGSNQFIPITNISQGSENTWNNGRNCRITLIGECNDLGVIYHEVFHSVYHGSSIWQIDETNENPRWGDAFCDAFRFLMHKNYKIAGTGDKHFVTQFRKCLKMDDMNITAQDSYKELGSRIIKCLSPCPSLNRYRSLWHRLNEKASNMGFSLYEFFGINCRILI